MCSFYRKRSGWSALQDPSTPRQLPDEHSDKRNEIDPMGDYVDLFPSSDAHSVIGIDSHAAIGLLGLLLFINLLRVGNFFTLRCNCFTRSPHGGGVTYPSGGVVSFQSFSIFTLHSIGCLNSFFPLGCYSNDLGETKKTKTRGIIDASLRGKQ